MVVEQVNKPQRKILLECIFRCTKLSRKSRISTPTQDKPFEIGLKVRNIGKNEFPGGKISGLTIKSMEEKSLYQPFEEEFSIPSLNPDGSFEVWIPNAISTYLSGLVWISCQIKSSYPNDEVQTYQIDRNTRVISKHEKNSWGQESYIYGKLEYEQSKTNKLILVLTVLTTLHGIFGLNNILKLLLFGVSSLMLSVGKWLGSFVR